MSTEFERTFDNAAEDYDSIRPEYPRELYEDISAYLPITKESRVLEVGLGTGKAAGPVLDTGCGLTGIEPGGNLLALAKKRLQGYSNLSLIEKTLQDYGCPDNIFDLVYSATAFHWIPEDYGYKRVYSLLRPGGAFARFAYHAGPDKKRLEQSEEIHSFYEKYMGHKGRYRELTDGRVRELAELAGKYGFTDTQYHIYHMEKDFTANEYMKLLRTYRDHMVLDPASREGLFRGIYETIKKYGGVTTVYYTVDLELGRKPG